MTGIVIGGLVFLAVFLGIFTINLVLTDLFKQDRSEQLKELEAELRQQMRNFARSEVQQSGLHDLALASHQPQAFSIVSTIKRFRQYITQAGLNTDPQKIVFIGLLVGSILCVGTYVLLHSLVVSLILLVLGGIFPLLYIVQKRRKRLDELSEQLPEALELMSRVMRAGQTVPQAMNAVADEFQPPIGIEFGYCYEQQNLGLSLDQAMRNLVDRTGLMEIKIMVMAMLIQQQAGGNLAELLDNLSTVMRERHKLRGTVRALTAEGRMQATFLVGLPFLAWIAMFFLNRVYALKLLDHPPLIFSTIGLMFFGMIWIRKIVNFDY